MLSMLIAYDATGRIVSTLDYVVARDEAGEVVGLIDFAALEDAGGKLRDVWDAHGADGSTTWPEWLGMRAHEFRVELDENRRATALVHIGRPPTTNERGETVPAVKGSGYRHERAKIETAIAERIAQANGEPADIRDLVGGPDSPLRLDKDGRTLARLTWRRPNLPTIGA